MISSPPLVLWHNHWYLPLLLKWNGHNNKQIGYVTEVDGFLEYNNLIRINSVFSNEPKGDPLDRTGQINTPLRYSVPRPWKCPTYSSTLDEAMSLRVKDIESHNQRINLMWSGGIDSTAIVNAFLNYSKDTKNLRVLYSPFSQYEHPEYLKLLQNRNIETVDISGTVYLDTYFDGIFVTGDMGDETHASIDESFLQTFGYESLSQDWKDFFRNQRPDKEFMDFCERYFSLSGIEIKTVLDARWWYYINSKAYCIWSNKLQFWVDYPNFNPKSIMPFYDCEPWERYIVYNRHRIMPTPEYTSWKSDLRDFSLKIDGLNIYHKNKIKANSRQLWFYTMKKKSLKNLHAIFILEDGSRISTPTLPLLSRREYLKTHGSSLDYLWNGPDKI